MQSELNPVAAKWKNVGVALQMKTDTLESIQVGNSGDPAACLTSVVTEWLKRNYNVEKSGEPTWQQLVEAVGHPAGGANKAVARDIARRHKAGGTSTTLATVTTLVFLTAADASIDRERGKNNNE